jgi:hypothetical protein
MEQVNSRYDRLVGPSHRRIIKYDPESIGHGRNICRQQLGAATVRLDTLIRSVDHECRVELGRAVMDLGGWLRRLGLEKYEAVFRENEIGEKVLPSLTAEDLKELGVARSCET